MGKYNITKNELEILRVLWEVGIPLHRGGILENSKEKTWKDSSIHILLNKMMEKGLLKESGFSRSGKVWARLYAPAFTVEEYYISLFNSIPPSHKTNLLMTIIAQEHLELEDIASIENMLHVKKESLT